MRRKVAAAAGIITFVLLTAPAVGAEILESDAQSEPGSSETTQLVTSSTEVQRAVVGLLFIAGVVGLITILYWYKTGQQARERFSRRYGGRHRSGQAGHEVADPRGGWSTDPAAVPAPGHAQPVYAEQVASPYPDEPTWVPQNASWPPRQEHVPWDAPAVPRRRPEFHE